MLAPLVLAVLIRAETPDIFDILDEERQLGVTSLLQAKTTTSQQKAKTVRESSGIISIIQRDEIVRMGLSDLSELLLLVPGFWFGADVDGVVGPGFRGNWGHEGKILLLIDGQIFNESLFGTNQFGAHYPLQNVKAVEIIRGPGSAIYGGAAELAVINVITMPPDELNAIRVSGFYGQTNKAMAGVGAQLDYGQRFKNLADLDLGLSIATGQTNRSDREYRDVNGNGYSLINNNTMTPSMVNAVAKVKDFQLRFLMDDYRTTTRDGIIDVLPATAGKSFTSYFGEAKYAITLFDKLTLRPQVLFKRQLPWRNADPDSPVFFDQTADRLTLRLTGAYDILESLNAVAGAEIFFDWARLNQANATPLQRRLQGGQSRIDYRNVAVFSELLWETFVGNFIGGIRFENHSQFGSSLVPRVGYTKILGDFHLKLLFSQAFKSPQIANLAANPAIKPERTTVFEVEVGYRFRDHFFVSANFFDISIQNPIVYFVDQTLGLDGYQNSQYTGSRGVEADLRLSYPRIEARLSYAFYNSTGKNGVLSYAVPGHTDVVLALPAHKVSLSGTLSIWRKLALSPSVIFVSERYGYDHLDSFGLPVLHTYAPTFLVNVYALYEDLGVKGLTVALGVSNLLDIDYKIIQPYNAQHAPLPAQSRQFFLKLSYAFSFTRN